MAIVSLALGGYFGARQFRVADTPPDLSKLVQLELPDVEKNVRNGREWLGKVVIVNNWATRCGPCRAEMPSLDRLYRDYADKVSFLFLTNDPKKAVDKYYEAYNFDFPTYMPISRLPEQINTNTLPATFILDKEGRVVLEEFGPADWNTNSVRELLDKLVE